LLRARKNNKKSIFSPAAANRPTPPRNYADGCDGLNVPNEGEQETKKKIENFNSRMCCAISFYHLSLLPGVICNYDQLVVFLLS
jgi:hypothetical protein